MNSEKNSWVSSEISSRKKGRFVKVGGGGGGSGKFRSMEVPIPENSQTQNIPYSVGF